MGRNVYITEPRLHKNKPGQKTLPCVCLKNTDVGSSLRGSEVNEPD